MWTLKTDTQTDLSRLLVYVFSFVLMCLASNITRNTVRYTPEGCLRAVGGNVEIISAFLSNVHFQMALCQIQMIKVLYNLHSLQLGHLYLDSLQKNPGRATSRSRSQPLTPGGREKVTQINVCIVNKQMHGKHKDKLPLPRTR